MDTRLKQLHDWLSNDLQMPSIELEPASADASFRRYFRVTAPERSYVAMDAPPDKENCEHFLQMATLLAAQGVHTPKVYEQNTVQGFLLLEDLGQVDYLSQLQQSSSVDKLYQDALSALKKIQTTSIAALPKYSSAKLQEEMNLFVEWFLGRHLAHELTAKQSQIWAETQARLIQVCQAQPQVAVHRDFHSRNLMVTERHNPGVIDFQDMVAGPISYDLASIFKDCYIEWPRATQLRWLRRFYHSLTNESSTGQTSAAAAFSEKELVFWYDLTGLQRHLKVLGIFCRLNYRDGKPQYLNDLPLVAKYCLEVLELYPELEQFRNEFSLQIRSVLR